MAQVIEYMVVEPPTNELVLDHALMAIRNGGLLELTLLPVVEVPRPVPIRTQMRISDTHHDPDEGHRFSGSNQDYNGIYIQTSADGEQMAHASVVAR